jgi:hypothetical protein
MIGSLFAILLGSLLIAIALAWAIGPARLLANLAAGLFVVPVLWAILTPWQPAHGLRCAGMELRREQR